MKISIFAAALLLAASRASAVIFASTGDPVFNTSAPGGAYAGSGWQYQGRWMDFLGTPIAPQFFITAEHIGGSIGGTFTFQSTPYVTDAFYDDAGSDLRIWHVTTAFPSYAPLYPGSDEVGKALVAIGRGTQRGAEVTISGSPKGWLWGTGDMVQRWGTNDVESVVDGGAIYGDLLSADFDFAGPASEMHLSVGDSGGAVFIQDTDNVWKLAGINFSVDGRYKEPPSGAPFIAAIYEQSGLLVETAPNVFDPAPPGPGSLYATRISSNAAFISGVTGVPEPSAGLLALSALACLAARRASPRRGWCEARRDPQ